MALVYGCYWYKGVPVTQTTIALLMDPRAAHALTKKYKKLVTPELLRSHKIAGVAETIAQDMSSLAALSVRRLSNHTVVVQLKLKTPLVRVNEQYIVTIDGTLVSAAEYNEAVTAQLPVVRVADMRSFGEQVPQLAKFIAALPAAIWEQYQIVWRNKTDIELVGDMPIGSIGRISLRAWHATLFTTTLLNQIEQIKKDVQERKVTKNKQSAPQWRIDVRMEKQLVVSRVQGEGR